MASNKLRLPNPHAKKFRPSAVAGPRVQKAGKRTNNAKPVLPEQIRPEGGAAKLKPGQRKKVAVKVPTAAAFNPFR
jgi:hypothetical protein